MTFRAVLIALCCAAAVCGVTYFNDYVMLQTLFIGNNMPTAVYGLLVVFMVFVYPVVRWVSQRLAPTRAETAVVLAAVLISCAVPSNGFLRLFSGLCVLPHRYVGTEPGWAESKVVDRVPPAMLVDVTSNAQVVVNGFYSGMRHGNRHIAFSAVPWRAWRRPIMFWVPAILLFWTAIIGLALVVHRQWSAHEQLPYPIVAFTEAMLPRASGGASPVFNNRLFWLGLGTIFLFHFNNFVAARFPQYSLGALPQSLQLSPIGRLFPTFERGGGAGLLDSRIYFTMVAIAYFLPRDISFSLGIGPFVWSYVNGIFLAAGIGTASWYGGTWFGIRADGLVIMGSWFGMFLVIAYTGRQYWR